MMYIQRFESDNSLNSDNAMRFDYTINMVPNKVMPVTKISPMDTYPRSRFYQAHTSSLICAAPFYGNLCGDVNCLLEDELCHVSISCSR